MEMDAMEDVVDTSDVEEREVMEAEKPGYYERVWGASEPEFPDGQSVCTETNNSPGAYKTVSFVSSSPLSGTPQLPLFFNLVTTERLPDLVDQQNDSFRSMFSLTPSPLSPLKQPQSSHTHPGSASNPILRSSSPITIPSDNEPQHRKYSLRNRSAKQLNPFQYDKQQYKRQLRGMPEAIVKDPNLGGGRAGRKERYSEEGENDWEHGYGDAEPEGDGDEEWREREKRRERQLQREALEAKMREFGIVIESSDENEALMGICRAPNQQNDGENTRGKRRKRALRVREFPMVIERENPQASPSAAQATLPTQPPPKFRPRSRPNYHGHSQRSPQSVHAVSTITRDMQMDVDRGFGSDLGDSMADDPWYIQNQDGPSHPMKLDRDGRNSPIRVDGSEDGLTPSTRKGRLKRHTLVDNASNLQILEDDAGGPDSANNDSEEASDESQDSEDVEVTGKLKKQLKALSRMVPGVLRNQYLANTEIKQKPKTKERTSRQDSDDEDIPPQPGRGRKRIVSPSSRDLKRYEVKGDRESESSSSDNSFISDREVIVVEDDGEEEDAERALEVSDDGLDAEDIQTWLAPERQYEELPRENTRRRRPDLERDKPRGGDLIDRMLQRTKRVMPRKPQTVSHRKPQIQGPRNPTIDVVTRGARRLGADGGRQTKLAFPKASERGRSSSGNGQEHFLRGPLKQGNKEHRVNAQDDKTTTKKTKKKIRALVQSKLTILPGNGYKATTGRPRQVIHIDDDDDAFHDALAPAESISNPYAPPRHNVKVKRSRPDNDIHDKFRHGTGTEPDAFDMDMNGPGPRHSKISLDFDLVSLASGLTLGPDSYIGKGRLYDFISVLEGEKEPPTPFSVTLFTLQVDPDMPTIHISPTFASACDKLYDASIMSANDPNVLLSVKASDALMHALCQMVTFRALHISKEEEGIFVTGVSEQINHLLARINDRVELLSADGHSMDFRSLALYWFAVEVQLRLVYAHQKRVGQTEDATTSTLYNAERYCVQLLRRLLEYGLDRTIGLLQNGQLPETSSANIRTLELWICIFHVAPFLTIHPVTEASKPIPPFWRIVEAAMDAQSNKPDSQLYESERIWRTMFSLCAISQFSIEGLSTSAPRLEAHWPIVRKALKCIRLSADVRDNTKPASTLHKRDTYLRLVTARCFLLCTRWNWLLNDADDMFQELCAIFRSRQFSNLLGEPDDFPAFIREGKEAFLNVYQKDDTAFALFLKLIVRSAQDLLVDGPSRIRVKLVRLLNLAVPVGSPAFTKHAPPTGQGLSMLYNRYSAIFVAIYVDPSATNIRSRLQQLRRYIVFKDADSDSRTAAIRSMMHLAILLRHLSKPLDDVLSWASEMIDDLVAELTSSQALDDPPQTGRNELVVLVQLLLGSIRIITNTPTLKYPSDIPAKYPDLGLLQAWISRIIPSPLAKDHRTGLEICKCIQSFLAARQAVIPLRCIPKLVAAGRNNQESQDEYGDGGLDLNDPALLAFLDDIDDRPDESAIADQITSDVLDTFSQPLFTCVCMHLGCTWPAVGSRYLEADQWLECWLGCGSVLVRNKKRVWDYYFQLGESAWKDISDPSRRIHLRLQFMLTVMKLDPHIYKSHENYILTLWFESIVTPELTIEHDFTARLFSIDGLRHALFQNIPCVADAETGYFAFNVGEFKHLRLQFIQVVLSNVSIAVNSGVGLYIHWVQTLLCTLQKWIESMNQDLVKRIKYVDFVRSIILAIRNQDALTGHPSLQNLLNWGGSL